MVVITTVVHEKHRSQTRSDRNLWFVLLNRENNVAYLSDLLLFTFWLSLSLVFVMVVIAATSASVCLIHIIKNEC